jgi:hypothetical protein
MNRDRNDSTTSPPNARRRSWTRGFAVSLLAVALVACSEDDDDANAAQNVEQRSPTSTNGDPCQRGALESDREFSPWAGPGVSPTTGVPEAPESGTQFIVSTTYLRLKSDDAAQQRFQGVLGPINDALATQPGLRALQTSVSTSCGTARTLSVWQDEASMYTFVGGEAHGAAMAAVPEISRGGSITTHFLARSASDVTWEKAATELAASNKSTY